MIKNVKIGINLLWIGFFGGLIIQNLYFWSLSSEGVLFDPFIFILSCLFVLPINIYELWLILKIRRGRNWARWTFLITHIISYLISIFTGLFDGPKTNFYFEEIHFAASLCSMIGTIFLFTPSAKQFFNRSKTSELMLENNPVKTLATDAGA